MLRVMAISPPHWSSRGSLKKTLSFNSSEPFSLQNAMRYAAHLAESGLDNAWKNSNLNTLEGRRAAVRMYEIFDEHFEVFKNEFNSINPDVLFIGSMTLSLPGAIAFAQYAKEIKKENILIVLGGKHINETLFLKNKILDYTNASPVQSMIEGEIKKTIYSHKIFDLFISGDGEDIISEIGKLIYDIKTSRGSKQKLLHDFISNINSLGKARGNWVMAYFDLENSLRFKTNKKDLDYADIPSAASLFGFESKFDVFKTTFTAHAFSFLSRGCLFNCDFCSEKSRINVKNNSKTYIAPQYLSKSFDEIIKYQEQIHSKNSTVSVFVEDSIFLGSLTKLIDHFISLRKEKITIDFGCQFTLDTFISLYESGHLNALKSIGLNYVAFGVETENEQLASSFSKNTKATISWKNRIRRIIEISLELQINIGMFVLWGIGESQNDRLNHLSSIKESLLEFGQPVAVGLNWAVEHPLRNAINKYEYLEWGIEKEDERLEIMYKLFGESSIKYCLKEEWTPSLLDLKELDHLYNQINSLIDELG